MKHKKLLIISHTEHYLNENRQIVGWGPTIAEVNYLAEYWEEIVHIGCFHSQSAPQSALSYQKTNIRFVPIPPFGGKTIAQKLTILLKAPRIIATVIKNQRDVSEVQLRLPNSMALFLLPLFSFFLSRKYTLWIKYAGNWNQLDPPLSYRIQRWWLINNWAKCKATINGFWTNQPNYCLSFENPCLTEANISNGCQIASLKTFSGPFILTFIGRLEDPKGVTRIITALKEVPLDKINHIHFIGDGNKMEHYQKLALFLGKKITFHGFLGRESIHKILIETHFLLLPSTASEGFPKVIAEAACYGVIPIVSDVGSISHYINDLNGFVWKVQGSAEFPSVLEKALEYSSEKLQQKRINLMPIAKMFTFENYRNKLEKQILNNNQN